MKNDRKVPLKLTIRAYTPHPRRLGGTLDWIIRKHSSIKSGQIDRIIEFIATFTKHRLTHNFCGAS